MGEEEVIAEGAHGIRGSHSTGRHMGEEGVIAERGIWEKRES